MASFLVEYAPEAERKLTALYAYLLGENELEANAVRSAADAIERSLTFAPTSVGGAYPNGVTRSLSVYPLAIRYSVSLNARRVVVEDLIWLPGLTR